ncbi:MAG: hypothetical protein F6K04_06615, partial [Leptolyngbya sp. SIO4C5]|nr:hypothetical protein [Leptolyngbya sp. SIO4C5]
ETIQLDRLNHFLPEVFAVGSSHCQVTVSTYSSLRPNLIDYSYKTLEKKCMEFYAEKILQQFDPDFFDEADNVKEFENLTLGKAPTPEKIKQMRERWQSQA